MYSKTWMQKFTEDCSDKAKQLGQLIEEADAVMIGAGAGLSTAAGFMYDGDRFQRYFSDFERKYGFHDMYSGGFYPYKSKEEEWAYWSRFIYVNRYTDPPKSTYADLLAVVQDKDYFVLTTNVDHCFQKAGFEKERLFYTQGDYGLFQCSQPCDIDTWDNEAVIRQMVLAQGYEFGEAGELQESPGTQIHMTVPTELLPHCPKCGQPATMNLRADDRFVEDVGWIRASERYSEFVRGHRHGKVLYLEIGVGFNTPGIVKYNFWKQAYQNQNAVYVCLNFNQATAPKELKDRALCIDGDSAAVIGKLFEQKKGRKNK